MAAVEGLDKLQAVLKRLAGEGQKKALRAGIGAGMTVLAKAARQQINASSASPEVKRAARQLIGKRFAKAKRGPTRGQVEAKVGFAVGMKGSKKYRQAGLGKVREGHSGFVSAASIRIFVRGTKERHHRKGKRAGKSTGKIAPLLKGVLAEAVRGSSAEALTAIESKVAEVVAKEAAKKG